jgi:hypothetical protein
MLPRIRINDTNALKTVVTGVTVPIAPADRVRHPPSHGRANRAVADPNQEGKLPTRGMPPGET